MEVDKKKKHKVTQILLDLSKLTEEERKMLDEILDSKILDQQTILPQILQDCYKLSKQEKDILKEELKQEVPSISDHYEFILCQQIVQAVKELDLDGCVITGLYVRDIRSGPNFQKFANFEIDTVLVIPKYKLIVDIEVKYSNSKLKKASNQTKKHADAFKFISKDWQFVKAACVLNLERETKKICTNCSKFIITEKQLGRLKNWLETILIVRKSYSENEYNNEYIDLLSKMNIQAKDLSKKDLLELSKETQTQLIGRNDAIDGENVEIVTDDKQDFNCDKPTLEQNSVLKDTITSTVVKGNHWPRNRKKKEENKSAGRKNYNQNFLCNKPTINQKKVLNANSSSIIIEGDHGTGKTYTLKKKAKACAAKDSTIEIAYIICYANLSLMQLLTDITEDYPPNVKVIPLEKAYSMNGNAEWDFSKCLSDRKYKFVFVDEKPQCVNISWSSIEDTKLFVSVTAENDTYGQPPKEKYFERVIFEHNIRNSENIVNLSKAVSDDNFVYSSR